ncbi:Integrin-linked protein kinase 1 [Linum perenne]
MENLATQLKRGISRQFSTGSLRRTLSRQLTRQSSLEPRRNNLRFSFGRQSSLDPIRRNPATLKEELLAVPENLDCTMQLLFMASRGDADGVDDLLNEGIDVNSIDLDGRTALHIAACEGHADVVKLLLSRKANIDARDRWGSTACVDAKFYGNVEIYNILKSRGAKVPKTRKTPMAVANPRDVPEYELNPLELQVRRSDGITKGTYQVAKWNGTKVAVKILDKDCYSDPESISAFKHELTLLEKVRHPNVVQFVGAVTQNIPMMIVVEYQPRGDLGSYLQKKGARNIMLDSGGQLKVAGFGLIKLSQISMDKAKVTPGTSLDRSNVYMAPEVYKDEIFDRTVDAYSYGVILYEMIEGVPPFHPKSAEEAMKLMGTEKMRPAFKVKSRHYPPDMKELIDECWHPEPVARPTFSEIIVRLDRIVSHCSKHGWWKDTFKLPWYAFFPPFAKFIVCRTAKIHSELSPDNSSCWDATVHDIVSESLTNKRSRFGIPVTTNPCIKALLKPM